MHPDSPLGTWLEREARSMPRGALTWHRSARRAYMALIGGSFQLGTVRRSPYLPVWVAVVPGFTWDVRGPRGSLATRLLRIGHSELRGFWSRAAAMRAVVLAYESLPPLHGGAETTPG